MFVLSEGFVFETSFLGEDGASRMLNNWLHCLMGLKWKPSQHLSLQAGEHSSDNWAGGRVTTQDLVCSCTSYSWSFSVPLTCQLSCLSECSLTCLNQNKTGCFKKFRSNLLTNCIIWLSLGSPPVHLKLGKGGCTQSEVVILAVRGRWLNSQRCKRVMDGEADSHLVCITASGPGPLSDTNETGESSSAEPGLRCCRLTHLIEACEELLEACKEQLAAQACEIKMSP